MRPLSVALLSTALVATASAERPQYVLSSSRDLANLLAIDFVATGPGGAPVTDLAASELTVRLGGKTRQVVAVEYVRAASGNSHTPDHAAPYGDNSEHLAPRAVILIVDEDTIRPGRAIAVRDAAQQFAAGLGPADRLALMTVPFGGLVVGLTTDHARVLRAMGALTAQGSRNETAADAECRTRITLGAMTDMLRPFSVMEHPVAVVFFSSHQAAPPNIIKMTGSTPVGSACDLRADTFTDFGAAAARAGTRFYVVHADLDQRGRGLDGLEHLAGVTGAPMLHLAANRGLTAVARILGETSGHYVARVARAPSDSAGDALGVRVSTSRPGVTVWRAPRVVVTRPEVVAAATPVTTLDLIKRARVVRDLPLRITGHTFRDDAAGHVKLAVTLDSPDAAATLSSAMVGAFDPEGRLVNGLEMSTEALIRRPVVAALSVPPGSYRLRLAALDVSGRAGSAEQRIDAGLTQVGPLRVSSLMVGLSRSGVFVPAMEFHDEPTAFGMMELYGAMAATPRVVVEIADATSGPAHLTMPGVVEATTDATRAVVTVVLPIAQLPKGDYVVRATITPAGHPSGRVVRAIRKGVR